MSIFDRIVSKLRDIVGAVREEVQEVREKFEERRAASLAERLDELAKGTKWTDWRHSIENTMWLVGEDGSYAGRTELWTCLGFDGQHAPTDDAYKGTAKQNTKLHKAFLKRLPSEGIPWPKDAS